MTNCFKCNVEMKATRITAVGLLPPVERNPMSIYYIHPKNTDCNVADYVIQIGYRA